MHYCQLQKYILEAKNLWKTIFDDVLSLEPSIKSAEPYLVIANPNYRTEMDENDNLHKDDPLKKDKFRNMQLDIGSYYLQQSKWLFVKNEVTDFNIEVRFCNLEMAAIIAVKQHPLVKELNKQNLGYESINVLLSEYRK